MVNLLAVPIWADQIGRIAQARRQRAGTARNASSAARAPVGPADLTTQTTALDALVPLEVTTGDPDENPNRCALLATSVSRAWPLEFTPILSTRRKSLLPR